MATTVSTMARIRHRWGRFLQDTRDVMSGEVWRQPSARPQTIVRFKDQRDLDTWKLSCDSDLGGKSEATFKMGEGSEPGSVCGVLSGYLSVAESTIKEVKRTGYCGVTSPERFPPWNCALTSMVKITCRADARVYAINAHFDAAFHTGVVWQGFITGGNGEWQTFELPFTKFIPVMQGRLTAGEWSSDIDELIKVGVSVLGKQGPFRFELESIELLPTKRYRGDESDDQNDGATPMEI